MGMGLPNCVTNTKGGRCPAGAVGGRDRCSAGGITCSRGWTQQSPQQALSHKCLCVSTLSPESDTKEYCESVCVRKQGLCSSKRGVHFMGLWCVAVLHSNGCPQKTKQYGPTHRRGYVTLGTKGRDPTSRWRAWGASSC